MFESRVKEGTNLLKHRQQRPALLLVGAGRIFKIKAPVQSKVQDKPTSVFPWSDGRTASCFTHFNLNWVQFNSALSQLAF